MFTIDGNVLYLYKEQTDKDSLVVKMETQLTTYENEKYFLLNTFVYGVTKENDFYEELRVSKNFIESSEDLLKNVQNNIHFMNTVSHVDVSPTMSLDITQEYAQKMSEVYNIK